MDEIVKEFLVESRENLDRLDRHLVELEKSPRDEALLADIFRTIHSIKGTTGFLDFRHLGSVAHAGETLLTQLRDGALLLNPAITNGLLTMVDAIREMLVAIEKTETDGERDYAEVIAKLVALENVQPAIKVPELVGEVSLIPKGDGSDSTEKIASAEQSDSASSPVERCGEVERRGEEDLRKHDISLTVKQRSRRDWRENDGPDSAIRVDVALLERLMDLMGELVLTRNQTMQLASKQDDGPVLAVSQRLNLVTRDMREIIVKTRLQPIQSVLRRFPRMVRDLAQACKKQVQVEVMGQETELDRTILEAIKDPLTHAVRNAIDHGIERPSDRVAAGKPREGRLTLRAFHASGQVNIEVSDDGAGIDPTKVYEKAVEKGLIIPRQADDMTPKEIINLIFQPGFSTAEKVTNVSGRGVGMDVVKTNIAKIGGTVEIQSTLGQGTTLRMKIPLTLAIIPVLLVSSSGDPFGIPQASLLELVRARTDSAQNAIEMVHGAPVYRLHGKLLPLLFLRRELGQTEANCPCDKYGHPLFHDRLNIVVVQAEDQQFGLVVDEIHDTEEIVVKPLSQHLKHIAAFAGATLMGDGEVALILDVTGIARCARLLGESSKDAARHTVTAAAGTGGEERQELLLFQTANRRRNAVPLASVERLEKFTTSQFEKAGQRLVVVHRGKFLPIVNLSDQFQAMQAKGQEAVFPVLICEHHGRRLGIVVDKILDIAEQSVCIDQQWKDDQSVGSAVVQQKVTDFLDLTRMLLESHDGHHLITHKFESHEVAL